MNFNSPPVWSFFVSLIAVVLSQFPPLIKIFGKKELKIFIPQNYCQISNFLGNLNLSTVISLYNKGQKDLIISSIYCIIEHIDNNSNTKTWTLPVRVFYPNPSEQRTVPVGLIYLKSLMIWSEYSICFSYPSNTEARQESSIKSGFRNFAMAHQPMERLEFPADLVESSIDMAKKLDLVAASYKLYITAFLESKDSKPKELIGITVYNFTLFENDIANLKNFNDFKYGNLGIEPVSIMLSNSNVSKEEKEKIIRLICGR